MALKGTLKDFALADIFQLIGQQQKSGSLYVRHEKKEAHIVFDAGRVVLGTFRKSEEDLRLGTMLLRAGAVGPEQLAAAIETQKVTMRSLGDILRGMGAITAQTLGEFVALQLSEVLFRMFQWKDGYYEFVAEQIRYNKAIIKPMSAEAVLMRGFSQLDEWPAIREKIGALQSVFKSLVDPADLVRTEGAPPAREPGDLGEFSDAGAEPGGPEAQDPLEEEKRILRLFDGHRSLQEIVYLSRLGSFETARIVASLLDRGLAIRVEQFGQTRVDALALAQPPPTLRSWLRANAALLGGAAAVAALLPLLAFRIPSHFSARYDPPGGERGKPYEARIPFDQLRRESERARIENLLELYRLERGAYPASLEEARCGPSARFWVYGTLGQGYTLRQRLFP